jgi:hypothetical protein
MHEAGAGGSDQRQDERMDIMSPKIETLETRLGKGNVHDATGHLLGVGQYEVHVFWEVHESPDGVSHRLEEIEGSIAGIDALNRVGEPLVLTLEDGRKLDFFFQDSDGIIVARGDLRRAER